MRRGLGLVIAHDAPGHDAFARARAGAVVVASRRGGVLAEERGRGGSEERGRGRRWLLVVAVVLSGRVVWAGRDLGGAAEPVRVVVMGCGVAVRWVLEVDECGFLVVVVVVVVEVQAEDLYVSRERLVPAFLLPPPVEFFLVAARRVRVRVGDGDPTDLGDVHVGEAVGFDGLVVEPGAVARLPREAADHAELGAAAARHVVAAFLELDRRGAVEAALPAFRLGDLDEFLRRGVLGALAAGVPLVVARAADFRLAPLAFAEFSASVGAAAGVDRDVGRFDPCAAAPCRAVGAVFGGVFLVLAVPFSFETVVEELVDMFQVDAVFGAAGGRHVLWVGCRKGEDAAETGVAHAVFAGQKGGFGDGDVIREAGYAFHSIKV